MTSEAQVQVARNIAKEIEKISGVKECIVDDWSDYGLFSLWLLLDSECGQHTMSNSVHYRLRCDLRSVTSGIKRVLKSHPVVFKNIAHPKPTYWRQYIGYGRYRKEYDGHDGCQTNVQFHVQEIEHETV